MPKKYDDAFRDKVNADILKLYGPTVTRLQLLEYKEKTGTFAVWIYRGQRAGRGSYVVPGGGFTPDAAIPPRKSRPSTERPVLPTPFDDDAYTEAAENWTPRQRKTPMVPELSEKDLDRLYPKSEKDVLPRPEFVSMFLCSVDSKHQRRELSDVDADGASKPCPTCNAPMMRHTWSKKRKIDWSKYEEAHPPKRGRKARKQSTEDDE